MSEQKWSARGLLLLVVALNLAVVYISVQLNAWNATFYNALNRKDAAAFGHSLVVLGYIAAPYIIITIYRTYFRQLLEFRWRQWLTNNYLERWLGDGAFYRLERDRLVDNPDQRISDDLQSLATTSLALSIDLLSTLVTLFSFVTILWSLSGAAFSLFGHQLHIPGYMVWASLIYAIVGSFVIFKMGRPLVTITYQQQRVEANFRFLLIRLRESSEQIALYNGADTEKHSANTVFGTIRDNWRQVMRLTKRLTLVNSVYGQIAIIFPFVVATPQYFAGAFTIGVLMQISDAFGTVSGAMSWFIGSYGTLAGWRATVNRLREFRRVIDDQHFAEVESDATLGGGINLHRVPASAITTQDLVLKRPNGDPMNVVKDLHIEPGARWLVRGPSGCGKSTLLRALAGLWAYGGGTIEIPVEAKVMFLPQQSYMPIDTLKATLTYPSEHTAFTDAQCLEVMERCDLSNLRERLAESTHWAQRLSPGEQQRIAFARVLLQAPDYVFMDESSSALDGPTEAKLYGTLISALPKTAIVSVGHRQTLDGYHQHFLDM